MSKMTAVYDALIIGGGPAGLAVATGLGRQLHTAVVFDSSVYRNARATHLHNYVGFDHQSPAALRAKARDDLERYKTIQIERAAVQTIEKTESGQFRAVDDKGREWLGRKVALAQGATDVYPDIPGFADCTGYGIWQCLFCHGFEEAGCPSAGVIHAGPMMKPPVIMHLSRQARRLAKTVTIYTNSNSELASQVKTLLEKDKGGRSGVVTVDDRKIALLARGSETESQVIANFEDGTSKTEGFMVGQPRAIPSGPFVEQLGLELMPGGEIKVKAPFNETSVKGVFAAGDCATPVKAIMQATSMGGFVAAGLTMQLDAEDAAIES